MMWAIMGVGMLFNALQGNSQAAQAREMQQAQQAETQKMLKSMQTQQQTMNETPFSAMLQIQTGLPEYPEENYNNLQEMQLGHMDARQSFTDQLQNDLQSAKTAFFENNHYETKLGSEGRPQVATDESGKPKVAQGKEMPEQKTVRLGFESEKKAEASDRQTAQKEQFLSKERENFKEFLAMNREQLHNPYIQGELQKMVVSSRKKSLELQQNHEDENIRIDLPPDEQIAAKVDQGMAQLRELDRKHIQAEEDSPDAKALLEHEQKVASILYDHKQRAQQEKGDADFLMDPRKMVAAAQAKKQPRDVGQVLPSYLTNHLYDMGIYSV